MELTPKPWCPLIQADCRKLDCGWFIQLRGKHPQSEKEIDEWGCAVAWLPILLIENAQQVRQGAAATESFRNAMVGMMLGAGPSVPLIQGGNEDASGHSQG